MIQPLSAGAALSLLLLIFLFKPSDKKVQYNPQISRRHLSWRLGAVAFFGVGEVGKTFGDFDGSHLVPGGGIGLRYQVTKKNHLNLRADYAWGKNSRAFYMSVGEAF